MRTCTLLIVVLLGGCAAYPEPYPARAPDPRQAQAAADAQCARTAKVAVKVKAAECSSANCTTTFECR